MSMTLEVLVGMIASGKSTYARRRADEAALVICHDDLTTMLHARYRYEQELRAYYRRMEEELVKAVFQAGHDAIVDRTHLTYESRRRWIKFARELWDQPRIIAVAFPIEEPEVHAMRRFMSDPRGRSFEEWLTVAKHHYEQVRGEPLSFDEDFDEIRNNVFEGECP